jgi:hypothetical protein
VRYAARWSRVFSHLNSFSLLIKRSLFFQGQQMAMGVKALSIVKSLTVAAGQISDSTERLLLAEKVSR